VSKSKATTATKKKETCTEKESQMKSCGSSTVRSGAIQNQVCLLILLAFSEFRTISDKSVFIQGQVSIATGLVQRTSGDAALLPSQVMQHPLDVCYEIVVF